MLGILNTNISSKLLAAADVKVCDKFYLNFYFRLEDASGAPVTWSLVKVAPFREERIRRREKLFLALKEYLEFF